MKTLLADGAWTLHPPDGRRKPISLTEAADGERTVQAALEIIHHPVASAILECLS
jgi:hypothetical protein